MSVGHPVAVRLAGGLLGLACILPLAGCGEAPPRQPVAGPEARKAVDAATEAYAACVGDKARAAAGGRVPGDVATEALKACASHRQALADKVMAFHRLGHPAYSQQQLRVVAEASIAQVEPQISAEAVVAYVGDARSNRKAD